MTNDKHIEQTVVNTCAGSDLDTAARLAAIPDDRHWATANDFAIREGQRSVPTGSNQQIHFACFRHEPPRVSLFRSHSYFDAMPDYSLPNNCGPERVIAGHFAVENQLNFSTPGPGIHRDGRSGSKSVR